MDRREIIKGIIKELEILSSESPRDFYYSIESYTDSYYDDSFCALILEWNKLGCGDFDEIFPITAKVFAMLKSVDDFVERSREVYAGIISMAKDALEEVRAYRLS